MSVILEFRAEREQVDVKLGHGIDERVHSGGLCVEPCVDSLQAAGESIIEAVEAGLDSLQAAGKSIVEAGESIVEAGESIIEAVEAGLDSLQAAKYEIRLAHAILNRAIWVTLHPHERRRPTWVAGNPSHLIHFDGERFLGPHA
jgi:hypothetical protein